MYVIIYCLTVNALPEQAGRVVPETASQGILICLEFSRIYEFFSSHIEAYKNSLAWPDFSPEDAVSISVSRILVGNPLTYKPRRVWLKRELKNARLETASSGEKSGQAREF